MEHETPRQGNPGNPTADQNAALINSFIEITSSSKEEALFFLESHQWDLDAAVSTFLDSNSTAAHQLHPIAPPLSAAVNNSPTSDSPDYSPSQSPSRSRSPSPARPSRPPYAIRSGRKADKKPSSSGGGSARGVRTLADLNRTPPGGSDSDSDEGQDYFTGGEKSGMVVRDPSKPHDVDSIFNQARQAGAVEGSADYFRPSSSSSRRFSGTARLLTGETVAPAPPPLPEVVDHTITFWRNGFTIDDGPLRQLGDPANASFIESVMQSQCPKELQPADPRTKVELHLLRRDENYSEPKKRQGAFHGVGRTLGSSSSSPTPEPTAAASSITTAPTPSVGLVVDSSLPTTSIQLRLSDGTRMISRFNYHHTIRDVRGFIDASRPGGARNYQLQTMGFPPKQLTDLDQTVEQAGIANSVVIQKY
ncbi:serine/threonine protein phosphatase 2A 55 kDa regulatory subunit B prime gamma [Hibiscus trionum]|uniref:Serine/threonine protein phosphatase 2A 55 kDa regulatory subunit B prime gamma n=1 Tax=Hibiscus trionum TaxID=183268 RepID=A0A9W7HEW7_HIBTR|nr:serine/threonine protein phosphatase 2A 55 kDa regulatory subunit B prime gamma [Hibiscus trionum]